LRQASSGLNVESMKKENVLITGASSGIGLELARQFAQHGHPLILTARDESELRAIADELATEGVTVEIIAQDLEQPGAAETIFERATQGAGTVDILVNNAGLGRRGKFWDIPFEADEAMIRVNVETVVHMTKLFLPAMLKRGRGRILNTASIAGFEPGPLLAVYHATKAFVLSFSEALSVELEKTGISVTALCPGATDTDFFPKANMVQTKAFQKNKVMAPQEVAKLGYEALMRGDRVYVAGGMNKALVFSRRFMSLPAQARVNKKFYEDAPPKDRKRKRGDVEAEAVPKYRRGRLKRAHART
jgi:short-subunit dehydrogenase